MLRQSGNTLLTILFGMAVLMPANADQTPPGTSNSPTAVLSTPASSSPAGTSFDVGEIPIPCPESFIDQATEGPYYESGSPERRDLLEDGIPSEPVILTGYVFDKNC